MNDRIELMTFSRQDCFKTCRKKHEYCYLLGIRPINSARALRMGSTWHKALETLGRGGSFEEAIADIRESYAEIPDAYDALAWSYECETIVRLLCGYVWRWASAPLDYIEKEQSFDLPLVNPETGRASTNWRWAGKIDGVVRLENDRRGVVEHKLLGEDIAAGSPLYRRLRVDHQISLYCAAARELGHPVECVVYDVVRKPTIEPTPVPLLDEEQVKIVLDRDGNRVRNKKGKTWRQTSSTEDGYTLQVRPMTPEEWGEKLTADIVERPDYYFSRTEIARLDDELAEAMNELWDIQKTMRDAQIHDRHYRTVNKGTCSYCAYFEPCTTKMDVRREVPIGFERVTDLHPELERNASHVDSCAAGPAADYEQDATTEVCAAASER